IGTVASLDHTIKFSPLQSTRQPDRRPTSKSPRGSEGKAAFRAEIVGEEWYSEERIARAAVRGNAPDYRAARQEEVICFQTEFPAGVAPPTHCKTSAGTRACIEVLIAQHDTRALRTNGRRRHLGGVGGRGYQRDRNRAFLGPPEQVFRAHVKSAPRVLAKSSIGWRRNGKPRCAAYDLLHRRLRGHYGFRQNRRLVRRGENGCGWSARLLRTGRQLRRQ